jgi:hypothetical protein
MSVATVQVLCSAAPFDRGRGMDPRVKPEDDEGVVSDR